MYTRKHLKPPPLEKILEKALKIELKILAEEAQRDYAASLMVSSTVQALA